MTYPDRERDDQIASENFNTGWVAGFCTSIPLWVLLGYFIWKFYL